MGQVYYDMGFLSSAEVIECSASDLVGQYVGHTGPKTRKVFERALGKVLFIDEAYRLNRGQYAKEAMDELVGILTQEAFRGKLVVILAGYAREMNELLAVNSGLSSRFPEEIVFPNMSPENCIQVLRNKLNEKNVVVAGLEHPNSAVYLRILGLVHQLTTLPSWGNARDIDTLSKKMVTHVYTTLHHHTRTISSENLTLPPEDFIACAETMLSERRERDTNLPASTTAPSGLMQSQDCCDAPPPSIMRVIQRIAKATTAPKPDDGDDEDGNEEAGRDPGVSDSVWSQLQRDKKLAREASRTDSEKRKREEELIQERIRQMGVCPFNYPWVKQSDGYRCEGGSHFIDNEELGIGL